jgi:methionine-rich copper-binding protein CopC
MSIILALLAGVAPVQDHSAHAGHAAPAAAEGVKRSMIKSSTPADGAMLSGPPASFEVTFVHAMVLTSVTITDSKGAAIPVTATPEVVDAASGKIALPMLAPGTYKLAWVGTGGSGREMRGELSFMVH